MCSNPTATTTASSVLHSIWEWSCSSEAGNLGSILSGIGTLLLFFLALAWAVQKRAEKKSDIAEYALDNLYMFSEEMKTWLEFANSWIVYSRHSEGSREKLNSLSQKEKNEFMESMKNDPYEATNYYKRGLEIIKVLKTITHRSKQLFDRVIDEQFHHLNEHSQKLPNKLMAIHFVPNPEEIKTAAKEYLLDSFVIIEKDCSTLHDLLIEYLMFRKKRFRWFRKTFSKLREKVSSFRCNLRRGTKP